MTLPSPISPPMAFMNTHRNIPVISFDCPGSQCGQRFPDLPSLAQHIAAADVSTHPQAIKKPQCPVCNEAWSLTYLPHHIRFSARAGHKIYASKNPKLENSLWSTILGRFPQSKSGGITPSTVNGSSPLQADTAPFLMPIGPVQQTSIPSPAPSDDVQIVAHNRGSDPNNQAAPQVIQTSRKRSAATAFQEVNGNASGQSMPPNNQPFDWTHLGPMFHRVRPMFEQQASSLSPAERFRLATLQEAVDSSDYGFILCHQILCLHNWNPTIITQLMQATLSCRQGMMIVDSLMNNQDTIRPLFFQFWCQFPTDLRKLMGRDYHYNKLVPSIMVSFLFFYNKYQDVRKMCADRRCPPSAGELAINLHVTSAVLQRVVFHALFQCAWPDCPADLLQTAMTMFKLVDQDAWWRLHEKGQYDGNHMLPAWKYFRAALDRKDRVALDTLKQRYGLSTLIPPTTTASALQSTRRPSQNFMTPDGRLVSTTLRPSSPSTPMQLNMPVPRQSSGSQVAPAEARRNSQQPQSPYGRIPAHTMLPQQVGPSMRPGPQPHASSLGRSKQVPHAFYQQEGKGGAQVAIPAPDKYALHLHRLCSPRPVALDAEENMYQCVSSFALSATQLDNQEPVQTHTFVLSDEQAVAAAKNKAGAYPGEQTRPLAGASVTYRLRCVEGPASQNASEWACRDTFWPTETNFKFNNAYLHPRTKLHFGKYLPIDLTPLVHTGTNMIEAFTLPSFTGKGAKTLTIAVERVTMTSQSQILQLVNSKMIPASDVVGSISRAINPISSDDGDDLQVLTTTIPIRLPDPLTGSIWNTPVRAKSCQHREAFDLETFVTSRRGTRDPIDVPSSPDNWFCPICKADARPSELHVDGFLVNLRKELAADGLLESAKVIDVDEHGAWKVREEKGNGRRSESVAARRSESAAAQNTKTEDARKEQFAVVDLSD